MKKIKVIALTLSCIFSINCIAQAKNMNYENMDYLAPISENIYENIPENYKPRNKELIDFVFFNQAAYKALNEILCNIKNGIEVSKNKENKYESKTLNRLYVAIIKLFELVKLHDNEEKDYYYENILNQTNIKDKNALWYVKYGMGDCYKAERVFEIPIRQKSFEYRHLYNKKYPSILDKLKKYKDIIDHANGHCTRINRLEFRENSKEIVEELDNLIEDLNSFVYRNDKNSLEKRLCQTYGTNFKKWDLPESNNLKDFIFFKKNPYNDLKSLLKEEENKNFTHNFMIKAYRILLDIVKNIKLQNRAERNFYKENALKQEDEVLNMFSYEAERIYNEHYLKAFNLASELDQLIDFYYEQGKEISEIVKYEVIKTNGDELKKILEDMVKVLKKNQAFEKLKQKPKSETKYVFFKRAPYVYLKQLLDIFKRYKLNMYYDDDAFLNVLSSTLNDLFLIKNQPIIPEDDPDYNCERLYISCSERRKIYDEFYNPILNAISDIIDIIEFNRYNKDKIDLNLSTKKLTDLRSYLEGLIKTLDDTLLKSNTLEEQLYRTESGQDYAKNLASDYATKFREIKKFKPCYTANKTLEEETEQFQKKHFFKEPYRNLRQILKELDKKNKSLINNETNKQHDYSYLNKIVENL